MIIQNTVIKAFQGDITQEKTDAIVNAANNSLRGGGGVDGAIHRAGGPTIIQECMQYDGCPTGEVRVTSAGEMPSQYVIHTVGPVYSGKQQEALDLENCYRNALRKGNDMNIESISFPSISTGVYGYPIEKAAKIAVQTVIDFLKNSSSGHSYKEIHFVLFSAYDLKTYERVLKDILAEQGS